MSQMDPREAHVAGPSQACAPCPARDGAFDPGPSGILCLKRLCGFPLPSRLEGLILRLGPDGERPPGVTLLRAYALGYWVAAPTILARELHLNGGIPAIIDGRRPADTRLARRTGRLLLVPINLEVLGVNAGSLAGLPLIIEACRPQQIDAIAVATRDSELSVQKAGIRDMGPGQAAPLRQGGVDLGGRCAIGRRAYGRLDVGDQVREVIVTGFRDVHFVAHPLGGVLAGIVGVEVVGRADELPRGRSGLVPRPG